MIAPSIKDNFFENPDKVKDYGLSLDFSLGKDGLGHDGHFPGTRTKCLSTLNYDLFNSINLKVLSLFFNTVDSSINYKGNLFFQKVDTKYDFGWVHQDPNLYTFIVYLSKNANINEGTSLYQVKDPVNFNSKKNVDKKHESFKDSKKVKSFNKFKLEHNDQYTETLRVGNLYNRLFVFNGFDTHAATSFCSLESEPRLTLIGFIHSVDNCDFPISRANLYQI